MSDVLGASRMPRQLDRRHFLLGAVAAAGGVVAAGQGLGVLPGLPWFGDAQPFTRTAVAERLGETFRVVDGVHDGVRLTLDSIAELPSTPLAVADDQFAARFLAPAGADLASDTYVFATSSFGRIPLFVSPLVDPDGRIVGYEALVNRYVPPALEALLAEARGDRS